MIRNAATSASLRISPRALRRTTAVRTDPPSAGGHGPLMCVSSSRPRLLLCGSSDTSNPVPVTPSRDATSSISEPAVAASHPTRPNQTDSAAFSTSRATSNPPLIAASLNATIVEPCRIRTYPLVPRVASLMVMISKRAVSRMTQAARRRPAPRESTSGQPHEGPATAYVSPSRTRHLERVSGCGTTCSAMNHASSSLVRTTSLTIRSFVPSSPLWAASRAIVRASFSTIS